MTDSDPYVVLGVRANASTEDIDDAFRALANLYHPDGNPGDAAAERSFKEVSVAHELLSDPVARARFDRDYVNGSGSADADHAGSADSCTDVLAPRPRYRSPDADEKSDDTPDEREFEFINPLSGNTITLSKRKILSVSAVFPLLMIAALVINALEVTGKWHVPGFSDLTQAAQKIAGPRQASVAYSPVRTVLVWIAIGATALGSVLAGLMRWVEHRANRAD